jgi:hypothetical protein
MRTHLIPSNVKRAAENYRAHQTDTPFNQGLAYGQLLRMIDRANINRAETLKALGVAFRVF